jgi:HSP20 family protein
MSMLVRRPSPYDELLSLRQAMDRLFDNDFTGPFIRLAGGERNLRAMPLDVRTDADSLTIQASLPGIRPEDVEITIEGGAVTVSTSVEEERTEEEGSYLVHEIRRGSATRSIALPDGLETDQADATFENGMLTLRIPRAEQVKPHRIKISPTTDGHKVTEVAPATDTPSAG